MGSTDGSGTSGPIGGTGTAENVEVALDEAGGLMNNAAEMIGNREVLDRVADTIQRGSRQLTAGGRGSVLRGDWLGHALHPVLTDLPIGFWTSAMAVDVVGGRHSSKVAKRLIALGVLSALPTAAAGLAEFSMVEDDESKRIGAVHLLGNTAAVGLFTVSWWKRTRGHQVKGMLYSTLGAAAATASAVLGGHLVYNRGLGGTHGQDRDSPVDQSDRLLDDRDPATRASSDTGTAEPTDAVTPPPVPSNMRGSSVGTDVTTPASDDFIDLAEAAERLGEPPQQVMALSVSGLLPNRGGADQPRFRIQDVEAVRLMGG